MKILYIDPNATTSQYNYPLVEELNRQNVNAVLVSSLNIHISEYYKKNYDIPENYLFFKIANYIKNQRIRRIFKLIAYPVYSLKFICFVNKFKPDIIHYNWLNVPPIDKIVIKYLKSKKYPIIITQHNFIPHENSKMLPGTAECLNMADKIICLSNQVKNRFPQSLIKKVHVISHGNTYSNELSKYTHSAVKNDKIVNILMIGSIKPYKGVMLLLKAFSQLYPLHDNLRLQIIGKADKSLQEKIESFIDNNKLGDVIQRKYDFISYEKMFDYIDNCQLGVLPYKWGSQSGLPYLFYAFNKPLLLSDSCGIAEQGNEKISIIVQPQVESIKKGISEFLRRKDDFPASDFAEYLSENSISAVAGKIIKLYNSLISNDQS